MTVSCSPRTIRLTLVAALAIASVGCSGKKGSTMTDPQIDRAAETPRPTPGEEPQRGSDGDAAGLEDIFYAYDSHVLSADARGALSGNAARLRELDGLAVTIEGHCDERGTVEYNLALGQRRAESARNYLVDLGIDGSRLVTISYGEERPFAEGSHEAAWSQNRRAHFRIDTP